MFGRTTAREQEQIYGQKSAGKLWPGHVGGQNALPLFSRIDIARKKLFHQIFNFSTSADESPYRAQDLPRIWVCAKNQRDLFCRHRPHRSWKLGWVSWRLFAKKSDQGWKQLPALSGIAQVYQELHKDKYLAGLLLSMLLEHLCWCVPIIITDTRRPVSYRVPTWSWASLDGKVIFDRSPPTRNIKIIEATTTPAGQNPLGQVRGGSITLEAQLNKQH